MDKTPPKIDYDKKIEALEDELRRKDQIIEDLRRENKVLLQTAFKNSERKLDTKVKAKVEHKNNENNF